MTFIRDLLTDLRALSWRLPFVKKPRQLGAFVRYARPLSEDELNYLSQGVADRLARSARLGGIELVNGREVRHYPYNDPNDILSYLGSVGWKADVEQRAGRS
jgi:hypothetical protein